MMLIWNWKRVLKRAWSVRPMAVAGLFSAAEVALPLLQDRLPVSPGWFAALSGLAVAGALVSRVILQRNTLGDDQ